MIFISRLNRRYKDYNSRKKVIEKIRDIRDGDAFQYYKEKFYQPDSSPTVSDATMKALFTDYKVLNQVIEAFVSFCPDLEPQFPNTIDEERRDKKIALIKTAMDRIGWKKMNYLIYDILESEGDCFYYIYFDEELDKKNPNNFKIPNLSLLDSINMRNIVHDEFNQPVFYIYKEEIEIETVDLLTGNVTSESTQDTTFIFEKGKVHRITPDKNEEGEFIKDKDGKMVIKSLTKSNRKSYMDIVPIIHIPSKKKQTDKFSIIPAEDYVELVLKLAQIQSDIRATNRQMGFPRITLLDCEYTKGSGKIGGVRVARSGYVDKENKFVSYLDGTNTESPTQGKIIQHASATNESFFREEENVTDYLYNLVAITNPTLMKRVGSSDSSKVLQQVNARMKKKIELYVDNIIEAFKVYFKVLLTENDLWDDEDIGLSFRKPRSVIENSVYDDLLIDQLELNTGTSTIEKKLRENGASEDEIKLHIQQVNDDIRNGKNDVKINKQVKQTVDNASNSVNTQSEVNNG